ncbi:histidine utilization repressor [Novosphingobium terrae]|uniref:histidine utilization repressor n=1 Tax=Novosphingobium terrae TaxID=2726189 RepID=UPI00198160F1|nr:histidine utilization repressor [Novosphingobium terrae]
MNIALHERIRAGIEAEIISGTLSPGDRLPFEHELMDIHGCSRMTVNKALSALATAGLIERRKRAGSFVARPKVHAMVLDIPDLAAEIIGKGQSYAYRLLSRKIKAPASMEERALAGSGRVLTLEGLHLADGTPLALERRLVALAAAPDMADADFTVEPPGSWLLHHVPWTEAENRISAIGATPHEAEHLGVEAGTACLALERRTWRGEEHITHVRQLFIGAAYDLVARFGPKGN